MNPTHYAIALRYEAGDTPAPLCVAKGVDDVALRIREAAEAHKIPWSKTRRWPARSTGLSRSTKSFRASTMRPVAKVIGFVMQQAKRRRALAW